MWYGSWMWSILSTMKDLFGNPTKWSPSDRTNGTRSRFRKVSKFLSESNTFHIKYSPVRMFLPFRLCRTGVSIFTASAKAHNVQQGNPWNMYVCLLKKKKKTFEMNATHVNQSTNESCSLFLTFSKCLYFASKVWNVFWSCLLNENEEKRNR